MYLDTSLDVKYIIDKMKTGFEQCLVGDREGGLDNLEDAIDFHERFLNDFIKLYNKTKQKLINKYSRDQLKEFSKILTDLKNEDNPKKLVKLENKRKFIPQEYLAYVNAGPRLNLLKKQFHVLKSIRKLIRDAELNDNNGNLYNLENNVQFLLETLNGPAHQEYGNNVLGHIETKAVFRGVIASKFLKKGLESYGDGDYEQAQTDLESAIHTSPLACKAYSPLAECYIQLGMKDVAKTVLQSFVEEIPSKSLSDGTSKAVTGRPLNDKSNYSLNDLDDDTGLVKMVH